MENVDVQKLKKGIACLKTLAYPLRIKILHFIEQHETTNVGNIYRTLQIEQSICSQNLRILRDANLVKTQRKGKEIFYSVNHEQIGRYLQIIDNFLAS